MSTLSPNAPQPLPPVALQLGRPSARSLLPWAALVLLLHLGLLLGLGGGLDWLQTTPQTQRTAPLQTRTITTPALTPRAAGLVTLPAARTRIAWVEKPRPAPPPEMVATPKVQAKPKAVAAPKPVAPPAHQAPSQATPEWQTNPMLTEPAYRAALDPLSPQDHASLTETDQHKPTDQALATLADAQPSDNAQPSNADKVVDPVPTAPADQPAAASETNPTKNLDTTGLPLSNTTTLAATVPEKAPSLPAAASTSLPPDVLDATVPTANPKLSEATNDAAGQPAAPVLIASATMSLPDMALASLPPSALLSYKLTGQEKGLNYHASGALSWQRNDRAYAVSLSVKALLLGSRHWRSVGQINATGLAPSRFSDSWRSERAAHFDRPNQRIVFSSNAPSVPLQAGAQDQVSLYVQLASVMAQSGQRIQAGARLQIQTATVRDALPWLLTLEKMETLTLGGQSLETVKWVCQPRNRFDAQVEFWVSAAHDWLPARIRITQTSGSFIDLQLTGHQALGDLAKAPPPATELPQLMEKPHSLEVVANASTGHTQVKRQ